MTLNLDKLAAECAQQMTTMAAGGVLDVDKPVDTLERLGTKALGVLQEQGVYALMIFLFSRTGDERLVAPLIRKGLYRAISSLPDFKGKSPQDEPQTALAFYSERVLGGLDTTLLVRDLYEQTLIYVRYGAKAIG
jgi:hypothetical protein